MNLLKHITKESDPIRQIYYTIKRTWLVDFINIFIIILKPVPCLQQNLYSCWFYPCWQWNLPIPSVFCTGIFYLALQKNRWMHSIMPVLMPKWIIPDSWMLRPPWRWNWFLGCWNHSQFFCVLMIPWFQSLAKSLKMRQNYLTMLHIMAPTIWMGIAL